MGPQIAHLLQQNPDWWYQSWGLNDWIRTLFNQPLEVHTFLLGIFIGILLATLTIYQHPRTTLTFTLVAVLFTFGSFETVFICSDEYAACQHLRLKPWYFIGGFLTVQLAATGLVGQATRHDPISETGDRTAASPLAGVVVLALLCFAAYSFVSPTPVHPITGLATLGGCLGAIFGYAAYEWAVAESDRGFVTALRQTLTTKIEETILIAGYGTVLGFGYPRLFWELGSLVGRDGFLFGDVIWARNSLPSVVPYVFVLFLVALVLLRIRLRRETTGLSGQQFAALVFGFATYAFWLFLLTGYAGTLWFHLIPAA